MCLESRARLLQLSALTFPEQEDPIKKKKKKSLTRLKYLLASGLGKLGAMFSKSSSFFI